MAIEFAPAKDAANIAKHGVSLARAGDVDVVVFTADPYPAEVRTRAYGYLDGRPCCLVFTMRGENLRAISLRRARQEEVDAMKPDT